MSHGPEHHIEHAEHAAHAAHDTFNTKVTISIAIIAAVLAAVTILGHQAHNAVLLKSQQATLLSNEAHNRWAQYQAHSVRSHLYLLRIESAEFETTKPGSEEKLAKALERWKKQEAKYDRSKHETEQIAKDYVKKSDELLAESAHWHHKAERLDLGDLGLQFGVVLASLAILTKRRVYWFGGIVSAAIGFAVAMSGQFDIMVGGDHGGHEKTEHKSEVKSEQKSEHKEEGKKGGH